MGLSESILLIKSSCNGHVSLSIKLPKAAFETDTKGPSLSVMSVL